MTNEDTTEKPDVATQLYVDQMIEWTEATLPHAIHAWFEVSTLGFEPTNIK